MRMRVAPHYADLRRAHMKAVRLLEYGGQLVFNDVDAGDRT
jgi:hypothetical protein